jgi:hypothetical protein
LNKQDRVQIEQYIKQDDYHWLLTLHNDLNGKISLDSLAEELLDFSTVEELETWLEQQ